MTRTNRRAVTATLAAAIGLAAVPLAAQAKNANMEKCYGIAAAHHNDCGAGAHSCAGQATMDRDPASFVYLPKGACGKIAGGALKGA